MAAKHMIFFMQDDFDKEALLSQIVNDLALNIDELPEGFPCEFSAQKGNGRSYFLIEYSNDIQGYIDELTLWERPGEKYKDMLRACSRTISMHYRDPGNARCFFFSLSTVLGQNASACLVENGFGCLLGLQDMIQQIASNPTWSWEKTSFPEIPGVADSEWGYLE
ncbi:MAG: hypothetical protein V4495_10735 [Pseudomonadota bacterium]